MGTLVSLPKTKSTVRYADRLQTVGDKWTNTEKRLVDVTEFLEAMIIVLDDERTQNIQRRDSAMAQIIAEELQSYQTRLTAAQSELQQLRQDYCASAQ